MGALLIGAIWVAFYFLLARYGIFLLPRDLARQTTLPQYLAGVQALSILVGICLTKLLSRKDASCWTSVFPPIQGSPARHQKWMLALLLAPLTYVVAHGLGMYFAYDTLIQELLTRGSQAVQKQTGELGRSAVQDSLFTIIPFTLVLAPLGEELLFRGAVFGGIEQLIARRLGAPSTKLPEGTSEPPESIQIAGLPRRKNGPPLASRITAWIAEGGGAALLSGGIFGLLHADTPGGLGIVRLTSALVLGVVLGLVRKRSGDLVAPVLLHMGYNFLSLATMRGWIVTSGYPTKYGIPTLLGPITGACLLASALLVFVFRRTTHAKERARPRR